MISSQLREALAQVNQIRESVIARQRFRGFSGRARLFSGLAALGGAAVMSLPEFPRSAAFHLLGWGAVCALAGAVNYGSLLHWWFTDPAVARDPKKLRPAFESLPPLFVGAVLTLALVQRREYHYLFGMWMSLAGLANLACQSGLPRAVRALSYFYMLAGAACLLLPGVSFFNPWPMGLVFFVGEFSGGIIFHLNRCPRARWFSLFALEGRKAS